MIYQRYTTGSYFLSGYVLEYPNYHYGFGKGFMGLVHTPARAIENTSNNILGLNAWLTGWYSGAIFFVILYFLLNQKFSAWERILVLCSICLVVFYFFFIAQDLVIGPRFLFVAAPVGLYLIALMAVSAVRENLKIASFLLIVSILSYLPFKFPEQFSKYSTADSEPGDLQRVIKNAKQPMLIFLDRGSKRDLVNWNEPFLDSRVIIAKNLGTRNENLISEFPDYRPGYFHFTLHFSHGQVVPTFVLDSKPVSERSDELNFLQVANAIQSSHDNSDSDLFDVAYKSMYSQLFESRDASAQLDFVNRTLQEPPPHGDYRSDFRNGILHAAKFILLPKKAFDEHGEKWNEALNLIDLGKELTASMQAFSDAGDTGKEMLQSLQKVFRRIDQDQNGKVDDRELERYFKRKLELLG